MTYFHIIEFSELSVFAGLILRIEMMSFIG